MKKQQNPFIPPSMNTNKQTNKQKKMPRTKKPKLSKQEKKMYKEDAKLKKELEKTNKVNKEKSNKVSNSSVDDLFPYERVTEDGIALLKTGKYSKSYEIPNINYDFFSEEQKERVRMNYATFITSFRSTVDIEFTILNERINKETYLRKIQLPLDNDKNDAYKIDINNMMLEHFHETEKAGIKKRIILSIAIIAKDFEDARVQFKKIDESASSFCRSVTDQVAPPMSIYDRLDILYKAMRQTTNPLVQTREEHGKKISSFSLENCKNQGITTKQAIAIPFSLEDYRLISNDKVLIKSFYATSYPTMVHDGIFSEFSDITANAFVSMYFTNINKSDAIKMIRDTSADTRKEIADINKKSVRDFADPSLVAPDAHIANDTVTQMYDEVTTTNIKYLVATYMITLFATSKEEMERYEKQLEDIAMKHLITFSPCLFEQKEALRSAAPFGNLEIQIDRLVSDQTIRCMHPFASKIIDEEKGIYKGQNDTNKTLVFYDKLKGANYNQVVFGTSGMGKSVYVKWEMVNTYFKNPNRYIYVIDPQNEYGLLAKSLDETVIKLAENSDSHINPLDLDLRGVTEERSALSNKIDFIIQICEYMIGGGTYTLSQAEKSIIDMCANKIYEPYMKYLDEHHLQIDRDKSPTLLDLYEEFEKMASTYDTANDMALALYRYVKGSSRVFSHKTNVNLNARMIVFDTSALSERALGLHFCQDFINTKVLENRDTKRFTELYIDEVHLLGKTPSAARYANEMWKTYRKYGCGPTGATQNVADILKNPYLDALISESSTIMLLGQNATNLGLVSEVYHLSESEENYLASVNRGNGLLILDNKTKIPLMNQIPENSQVFKLVNTKPQEN